METAFYIYLYLTLSKVIVLFEAAIALFIAISAAYCVAYSISLMDDEEIPSAIKGAYTKLAKVIIFVCLPIYLLFPDKEDIAYIFGGTALISIAQTEEAQKLPDNILEAVNVFLEGVADEDEQDR